MDPEKEDVDLRQIPRPARAALTILFVAMSAAVWFWLSGAQGEGVVITPSSAYGSPAWRDRATKYQSNLSRIQGNLGSKWTPAQFKFLTMGESTVGGLGFWPNPIQAGGEARYLGVFVRVNLIPAFASRFPDSEIGRVQAIMDAFGKETIYAMAKEMQTMPEQEVAGGAMIFIYGKEPVTSPGFEQSAEALALFMPKGAIILYAQLRMTNQTLFSQSQMLPIFKGADQIGMLRNNVLAP